MSAPAIEEPLAIAAISLPPILDHTLAWAAINSGSGNLDGLAAMAATLADAFKALPGQVALLDAEPVDQIDETGRIAPCAHGRHLLVSVRPEAARRVLLTGHMDTVYGSDHPFQTCDWLDETRLRGPGVADMKGGLALLLAGLQAFEETRPELGYDVFVNSDEEVGSPSSSSTIARLAAGKFAALTFEPALPDGSMARGRPGSGNFALVVTGRPAHAGRNPEEGRNAIVAASACAVELAAHSRDGLRINCARISGGGANNMVPERAVLHVNIRPRHDDDATAAEHLLATVMAGVSAAHGAGIDLHGSFGRPPKRVGQAGERLFALVRQAAADLGEMLAWQDTGGVCDGNNIAACGVPVIDTMGACGGLIHSPDEFLIAPSLVARARLAALVMQRLDQGGLP